MEARKKVSGERNEHDVKLFAISTCGWCKKVKKLLKSLDVEHEYVDIDVVQGEESKEVKEELKEYNPSISCPTLVIDEGEKVIIGYKKDEIEEALSG